METPNRLETNYNPETKTIDVAYYLLGEKPNSFQIINIQEIEKPNAIWADGAVDYRMKINTEFLSKKMVEDLGPVEGMEGYHIFRLPYWLYKKDPNLNIIRISNPKKRFSTTSDLDVRVFGKQDYLRALESVGTDMSKVEKAYSNITKSVDEPKKSEETPVVPQTKFSLFGPSKNYWGD